MPERIVCVKPKQPLSFLGFGAKRPSRKTPHYRACPAQRTAKLQMRKVIATACGLRGNFPIIVLRRFAVKQCHARESSTA
jgi:hypothetical protein